jgi:phosphate transport system permease protein
MTSLTWRKVVNVVMLTLTGLCALLSVSVLLFVLGYLGWNGWQYLTWTFLTHLPQPVGETGGGMANAIVGSGTLLLIAALTGIPIGFMGGIYLAEFGGSTFSFLVRYTADLLNGVPSIVMGIFAYTMVVLPLHHFSALAGGLALGVMLIPIVLRSTEEFLRAVPRPLREGALALGASKWKAIATIVIPASIRAIATGALLGLARVAGETAPLLFTSFNNQFWNHGLNEPTASLPVMIYVYAISPYNDWHRQAWAAGFILLMLVLVANIGARLILSRGTPVLRG